MKRQLLLALCLLTGTVNASAQGSYIEQAYSFLFGSCPSYTGQDLDIYEKSGDGLNATYYNGTNFDYEVLRRTDPEIYFYYSGTSPAVEVNVYQFSVVWTGYLYAPVNGDYTLTTNVDDGVRMWINGNQLIDKWGNESTSTSTYTQNVKLEGKQAYEIRIEYYQANKDARIELYWAYEGQSKRIVPQKYLFTNIDEPPLVLLGPSFMGPSMAQKKYHPNTRPDRPLQDENIDNPVVLTSSKTSSPIASNIVQTSTPYQPKLSSKKPAKEQMVYVSEQKTNSKPIPVVTAKASPTTEQKTIPKPTQEIVASSNLETKPKISSPSSMPSIGKTREISTPANRPSLRGGSASSIVGNLGSGQITETKEGSTSFLSTATDKTTFKPALKLKPRRSGPVILHNILFDKDKYRLKPSSYNELNALVDTLQKNPTLNAIIAGHTDYAGDPIPNKKLSESRARAVTIYLIRHGIDASRIQTKGYGGTKPLSRAPLGTEERRRNKRVEYILIEEGAKP